MGRLRSAIHEGSDLPAGTFDTQFTFAQTLSESAKAARKTLLVVSVPSSDNEIGGEWGRKALDRLKNAIGRVEASWRPASPDEGFEIVRRRLFEPIVDPNSFVARDAVARAFSDLYHSQHREFPPGGTWKISGRPSSKKTSTGRIRCRSRSTARTRTW